MVPTAEREFSRAIARLAFALGWAAAAIGIASFFAARAGAPWMAACLGIGIASLGAGAALHRSSTRRARALVQDLGRREEGLRAAEQKARATSDDLGQWVASAVKKVRDLSERVVQIQEMERGRMARDLHDSVGQALTALRVDLELLQGRPDEAPLLIGRATAACQEAMTDLRRVVYDLQPPELTESADVGQVLRSYAERFEVRTGLPTSFRASGGPVRSREIAACLLRVLQEALTNVSRHAVAREVGIALQIDPGQVRLEITDDGQGFDVSEPRGGTGLRGMEERCAFLGGALSLDSGPDRGTKLTIQLPLERGAA